MSELDARRTQTPEDARLRLVGICKTFRFASGMPMTVLDNVDLDVAQGEVLALMGPSGCGKSTLLSIIAGWMNPDRGMVLSNGAPVRGPGPDRPICFQGDTAFSWMTVSENISFGRRAQGLSCENTDEILERVGLTEFADQYPKHLSGGMRKRLELARVFAAATPRALLLLDEAFGSVDPPTKVSLHELLRSLLVDFKHSAILATHDVQEAVFAADRIVALSQRPARARLSVDVPFAARRDRSMLGDPQFTARVAELHRTVFEVEDSVAPRIAR